MIESLPLPLAKTTGGKKKDILILHLFQKH